MHALESNLDDHRFVQKSARILCVDDDPILRRLSTQALTRAGYRVTPAPDGRAALEALHATQFDLLITDNRMPHLTGLELVAKARSERMDLPIIMASGSVDPQLHDQYAWLRITLWLHKPFGSDQLLQAVRQALIPSALTRPMPPNPLQPNLALPRQINPYPHWGLND